MDLALDDAAKPSIATAVADATPRRIRPVLVWAGAGLICIAIATWAFTSWIVSGDAHAVPTGVDPLPAITRTWAVIFQVGGSLAAVFVVMYVVRKCFRERGLCLDAMIVIATATAWWHDPLINWLRPMVFYNAGLVNFGSWTEHVPGWISPNARYLPEPVFMIGSAYVWMDLGFAMLATWAMRGAHSRRPRLGVVGTFCAGWAAILMLEFPLEMLAVHTGLVGYPGTIPELTLWAGRTDQLPLYGPLLWSATLASLGMLRFYRDDRGRTVVERGIDRVPFGTRTTTALRALAVLGFIHISMILCYDVPINLAGLYAGPAQTYPSYLRTTQCGADAPVPVECPGPASPILVDRR